MICTFPFKTTISNFYHVINELVIAGFYISLIICTDSQSDSVKEKSAESCKYLIMIAWGLNIEISASLALIKVGRKIKQWLSSRKSKVLPIFEENPTKAFGSFKTKVTHSTWENKNEFFTKPMY